ncbi:MAG TPA: biotin carboxylase N-terminal domain-containing protein [Candidatus Limnocylindrales bacterium]|nr:biotin carboxylase N-terminal domain-containing protein [Candidatus Limnocylindrales bacterium]
MRRTRHYRHGAAMGRLIGPNEAARMLGVSPRTVERWLRAGRLPGVRVGTRVKVDIEAVESVLGASKTADQGPASTIQAAHRSASRSSRAASSARPIQRLLVANRGELVVRIARTSRRLGIGCLGLVTDDQADAWWARQLDEVIALPAPATYLDGAAIVTAALAAGVDAIHPGYGFLAERPDFAEQVLAAGLTWVGPPPDAMRALGDKAAARRLAQASGVPVLPGYDGRGQSDAVLAREAARIGYPVLIKPSAGGGGKGMHLVERPADLRATLATARREARAAFGDARLILERYLGRPRHVEIQLLADRFGRAVHLGERDCSLQRRHQKVIEEAPAPGVSPALRAKLGAAALRLALAAGYEGAGTAEFLLGADGSFWFLELNARLQVEHPVTEAVTGLDLVELQLLVAAGQPLPLEQAEVQLEGHAIEARLYAEAQWAGFLPVEGRVVAARWPAGPGLRIDAGVGPGDEVGLRYDPLLAKIVARGADREEALERLSEAVTASHVFGVDTNRGFLRWLLDLPATRSGTATTETIETDWTPEPTAPDGPEVWAAAAAALDRALGPSAAPMGFRLNARPSLRIQLEGEAPRSVAVSPVSPDEVAWAASGETVVLDLDGRAVTARLADPPTTDRSASGSAGATGAGGDGSEPVRAPMPGTVLSVAVEEGQAVTAHQPLLTLEAMKMENAVTAPSAGRVVRILVAPGQAVRRDDPLIILDG